MARSTSWNRTRRLSVALIGALLLRDRFSCAHCGVLVEGTAFELDHVDRAAPEEARDRPANLVVSCADCNRLRGAGPVPKSSRAEVRRRVALPVDLVAGRAIGEAIYPWEKRRRRRKADRERARYRLRRWGPEGPTFDPAELRT